MFCTIPLLQKNIQSDMNYVSKNTSLHRTARILMNKLE